MSRSFDKNRDSIPEGSVTRKIIDSLHDEESNHGHDGGNQELWLVSYADLMTLLFGFFVMMYSDSSGLELIKETLQSTASTDPAPVSTPAPTPEPTPQGPSPRELALEERIRILENQRSVAGRLLNQAPCRICLSYTNVPSYLESTLKASSSESLVVHVSRGGPADQAGLRSGDILESVEGEDPKKPNLFASFPVGQEIRVRYRRLGVRNEARVKLDQASEEARKLAENEPPAPVLTLSGGIRASKIGLRERITRYIPSDIEGLLVLETCSGCYGPAKGEVIVAIDGVPVDTPDSISNSLNNSTFFEVWNPHNRMYRIVKIQSH
jgi:flagellar motor protein MotB